MRHLSSKTREGMGDSLAFSDYEGSGLELVLRDQGRMEMKSIIMKRLQEPHPTFCEHVLHFLIGAGAMFVIICFVFIMFGMACSQYR